MYRAIDHDLAVCEERGDTPDKPFSGQLQLRRDRAGFFSAYGAPAQEAGGPSTVALPEERANRIAGSP